MTGNPGDFWYKGGLSNARRLAGSKEQNRHKTYYIYER